MVWAFDSLLTILLIYLAATPLFQEGNKQVENQLAYCLPVPNSESTDKYLAVNATSNPEIWF